MKQGINSRRTGNLLSRAGNLLRLAGNCPPGAFQILQNLIGGERVGDSSTVEQRTLTPSILVRIHVPQPQNLSIPPSNHYGSPNNRRYCTPRLSDERNIARQCLSNSPGPSELGTMTASAAEMERIDIFLITSECANGQKSKPIILARVSPDASRMQRT
jgi:hypothetical protein